MPNRKIIVYGGTSADAFIARSDDDIEWLTSRPEPEGFYDIGKLLSTRNFKDGVVQLHLRSPQFGETRHGKST